MLVVKLPQGKPPFIGILFSDKFDAENKNSNLIQQHKDKTFHIVLEFLRNHVTVKLICDEALLVVTYPHESYNEEQLKNWFYLTRDCNNFNFSQIYEEKGIWRVAKTFHTQKTFVLKVNKYQVFTAETKPTINGITGKWAEW